MERALLGLSELCDASGARPAQIEFWCRVGIIVPATHSRGRGFHRAYTVENVLEATQAAELTKAGLSSRQLQHLATVQRAALEHLPFPTRMVTRYRAYIATIQQLAAIFGRGLGYDAWLKMQTQQLRRMERDVVRFRQESRHDIDHRLLDVFVDAKPAGEGDVAEPPALLG